MSNSINTNNAALIALKTLNGTNRSLDQTQNRVSTGFRVGSAVDDGATFAVAQNLRGDILAFETTNQQLNFGKGVVGVALEASTAISNTLNTVRSTITKLADNTLSTAQRAQYDADFTSQLNELLNYVANSDYNGASLITAAATPINVLANIDGTTYTITNQDLETTITALQGAAPADAAAAAGLLDGSNTALNDAILTVNNALNSFAAASRRIGNQIDYNTAVRDATETGLGAIVDADLARESAKLQALQTKQQLGVQTLGIANQAPGILLRLFQ